MKGQMDYEQVRNKCLLKDLSAIYNYVDELLQVCVNEGELFTFDFYAKLKDDKRRYRFYINFTKGRTPELYFKFIPKEIENKKLMVYSNPEFPDAIMWTSENNNATDDFITGKYSDISEVILYIYENWSKLKKKLGKAVKKHIKDNEL